MLSGTGLTSFEIPSHITSVGAGAFQSCASLSKMFVPSSVTTVGSFAFDVTNLGFSVYFNGNIPTFQNTFNINGLNIYYVSGAQGIGNFDTEGIPFYLMNPVSRAQMTQYYTQILAETGASVSAIKDALKNSANTGGETKFTFTSFNLVDWLNSVSGTYNLTDFTSVSPMIITGNASLSAEEIPQNQLLYFLDSAVVTIGGTSYSIDLSGGSLYVDGTLVPYGETFLMNGSNFRFMGSGSVLLINEGTSSSPSPSITLSQSDISYNSISVSVSATGISGDITVSAARTVLGDEGNNITPVTIISPYTDVATFNGLLSNIFYTFTATDGTTSAAPIEIKTSKHSITVSQTSVSDSEVVVDVSSTYSGTATAVISSTTGGKNGTGSVVETKTGVSVPGSVTFNTGLAASTQYSIVISIPTAYAADTASTALLVTTSAASGGGGGDPPVVPCFLGNARVMTPAGYKRMDSLRAGDKVTSPSGKVVTIEAVKLTLVDASKDTNPYVIEAGQFGCTKRLLISPEHKVVTSRGLVKARELGLRQEAREGVLEYYNLRLTGEEQMVVQGVAVESLAHVERIVMSRADFERRVVAKYGNSPAVAALIARTCRFLDGDSVECPVMRRA
jgi:hypothetical protein